MLLLFDSSWTVIAYLLCEAGTKIKMLGEMKVLSVSLLYVPNQWIQCPWPLLALEVIPIFQTIFTDTLFHSLLWKLLMLTHIVQQYENNSIETLPVKIYTDVLELINNNQMINPYIHRMSRNYRTFYATFELGVVGQPNLGI